MVGGLSTMGLGSLVFDTLTERARIIAKKRWWKVREGKPEFRCEIKYAFMLFSIRILSIPIAFHSLELQLLTPFFLVTKNLLQDELKKKFRLWGGKEKPTFGEGRRGGIPALVGEAQGGKWVEGSHRLEKNGTFEAVFRAKRQPLQLWKKRLDSWRW